MAVVERAGVVAALYFVPGNFNSARESALRAVGLALRTNTKGKGQARRRQSPSRGRQCGADAADRVSGVVVVWRRQGGGSVPQVYTERSGRPWVTLNFCVLRRYDLEEGDLVSIFRP